MSVYKAILKSLRANMINILVYFSIFAIFGNISARATASTTEDMFREVVLKVAVTDYDNSLISQGLVEYLNKTQNVVDPQTEDPIEMNDNVRFGIYQYALVIPEGLSDKLQAGETEDLVDYIAPGSSMSEYLLTEKINAYLKDVVIYIQNGYTEKEAVALTNKQMLDLDDTKAIVKDTSEENHRSFYTGMFTFNGYSLSMALCICISTAFIFMKEKDVRNRISVSGMSFKKRNVASILAVLSIGIMLTAAVIVVICIMAQESVNGKFIYYILDTLALMVIGIGIAYFISSLTENENLINMLSNMIILSMCFLCGVFVDLQFLSEGIIKVAHFLPLYWYVTAIKFINDTPINEIMCRTFGTYLMIQILFAIAFFVAGMIISKKKEQYAV